MSDRRGNEEVKVADDAIKGSTANGESFRRAGRFQRLNGSVQGGIVDAGERVTSGPFG